MTNQQEYERRLQNVVQQAQAGNPDAQYALAVLYSRKDINQSLDWINKAIAQGHPGAIYTLGAWYVQGALLEQDYEEGAKLLNRASNMNFPDADMMLASLAANGAGQAPDWKLALSIVMNRARGGMGRALCQLGFLMKMTRDPAAEEVGDFLIEAAAERFELLAMYAWAKGVLTSKAPRAAQEKALQIMATAAKNGQHPLALKYPGIDAIPVAPHLPEPEISLEDIDWGFVEDALAKPPIPEAPQPEILKKSPFIATYPGFLSEEESDYMIGMAVRYLAPSQVIDPITGKYVQNPYRSSHDMRFNVTVQDLVIFCFNLRIAAASGEPKDHQETLGVLRYEPGQQYKPHGDYLTPDSTGANKEVETSGQRIKTFLVYLNEDFEGGETEFPNIDLKTKGKKGDGLMFINVTDKGEPNPLTIHAGRPVTSGVKWLSTMWIRAKKYQFLKPVRA